LEKRLSINKFMYFRGFRNGRQQCGAGEDGSPSPRLPMGPSSWYYPCSAKRFQGRQIPGICRTRPVWDETGVRVQRTK
jgi:hypothetical protein